jgi:hypothetical protein
MHGHVIVAAVLLFNVKMNRAVCLFARLEFERATESLFQRISKPCFDQPF